MTVGGLFLGLVVEQLGVVCDDCGLIQVVVSAVLNGALVGGLLYLVLDVGGSVHDHWFEGSAVMG